MFYAIEALLRIPGLADGLVMEGEVVFLKGYGQADEEGRLVTPQTPFIIGSISKSFTALAILQLEEQGKLELDNEVQFYLPWFKLQEKAGIYPITIRDLLRQSSGISTYDGRALLVAGVGSSPAVGPLIFLFWFPSIVSALWPLILLFMPGWGHVLLITPIMLAIIGLIEEFILVLGSRRRAKWRTGS